MALGSKILWGIIGFLILNTVMDFIVTWIVQAMGLSFEIFSVDMSGWINSVIAGIINATFIIILLLWNSDTGDDKK